MAIGAFIGIADSLAISLILASQLWRVSPHHPVTLGTVVAMVGLAACYFPARCSDFRTKTATL